MFLREEVALYDLSLNSSISWRRSSHKKLCSEPTSTFEVECSRNSFVCGLFQLFWGKKFCLFSDVTFVFGGGSYKHMTKRAVFIFLVMILPVVIHEIGPFDLVLAFS